MNTTYEIEQPFTYSWSIVIVLAVVLTIVVLVFLFYIFRSFFAKRFSKMMRKLETPVLRSTYIHKLEQLIIKVTSNRISNRDAYVELSTTIRDFIEKVSGINVVSLSKKEIKELNIDDLSLLMEEYYPPEFAKYTSGDVINSINRTIEVIKRWNLS